MTEEIVRGRALDRIHIALDYFDASINRVGAWVIGARAVLKGLLCGLLLPEDELREAEAEGRRLRAAWPCARKPRPCRSARSGTPIASQGVPAGPGWIDEVGRYEKDVLAARS